MHSYRLRRLTMAQRKNKKRILSALTVSLSCFDTTLRKKIVHCFSTFATNTSNESPALRAASALVAERMVKCVIYKFLDWSYEQSNEFYIRTSRPIASDPPPHTPNLNHQYDLLPTGSRFSSEWPWKLNEPCHTTFHLFPPHTHTHTQVVNIQHSCKRTPGIFTNFNEITKFLEEFQKEIYNWGQESQTGNWLEPVFVKQNDK